MPIWLFSAAEKCALRNEEGDDLGFVDRQISAGAGRAVGAKHGDRVPGHRVRTKLSANLLDLVLGEFPDGAGDLSLLSSVAFLVAGEITLRARVPPTVNDCRRRYWLPKPGVHAGGSYHERADYDW